MPKRTDIHKIMVIGSGPIIIGQAAEFDYSGTQACLALKEEGYETVLVNSNPATIMTDKEIADHVYIEPLTVAALTRILRQEAPDALLPTLGGQIGLNLAVALSKTGILDELGIELLGTKLASIDQAEDREKFKELMQELGEPVPASLTVSKGGGLRNCFGQLQPGHDHDRQGDCRPRLHRTADGGGLDPDFAPGGPRRPLTHFRGANWVEPSRRPFKDRDPRRTGN